jgi:phospho-N-acetylmuramoyl-pentapeptide-transferase
MAIRMMLGFTISLVAVLLVMPHFIDFLKKISFNQTVNDYSLQEYKDKAKTPIMGGVLFIVVPVIVTIVLMPSVLLDFKVCMVFLAFIGYGLIGFTDDFLIAVKKNNDGLKPAHKFALQLLLAIIFYLMYKEYSVLNIQLLFNGPVLELGFFYVILILFMFTGTSNAVNLTDGMDGLAAGCSFCSFIPFMIYAVLSGYTGIAIFIASLLGALLGYLHYNVKPAKIFMGDTGSLALGGVLAAIAMVLKKEISLVVIGGVFVVETLCVIIQITSVKTRHKKVFPYTPIHYSFVIKGMSENNTVHLFWIVSLFFAIIGFFAGK